MEIVKVEIQERMRLPRWWGKLKKGRACLINGYSSLSKAFSRSILRIILASLPFILKKWLIYSWTIMVFFEALFLALKLAWFSPIRLAIKGFILEAIILVMTLY